MQCAIRVSFLRGYLRFYFAVFLVGASTYCGFAQSGVEHFSLNGKWQFRQTATDPLAENLVGAHPGTTDWHAAMVPGVVQTDLLANGLIPPPFYRDDESKLQWIGLANWEYQRTFNITPQQLRETQSDLVFHGLDTFAKIFVNDQQILSADNMFRTWRIDVHSQLHVGTNTIRVEFASPILSVLQQVKAERYPLPDLLMSRWAKPLGVATSNYVRKAPYNYGWDWGPRFLTAGIWQPVEIEFWSAARIDNVYVRQLDVRPTAANLSVEADIVASAPEHLRVDLDEAAVPIPGRRRVPATGQNGAALQKSVWLHAGINHVTFPLNIDKPALWYPMGYGTHPMYSFQVGLSDGIHLLDRKEVHTGLRSVKLHRRSDQWGISFTFVVNGIPIFAKGANVIPMDSFPTRVTDAQMERVLQSARDANMNMIRVWGGGYYETDRFYEIADQMGLMVWQEFMFGGAMYPYDKPFLDNVRQEAIDQVRRLRNHPSIVLWCGNNESETGWYFWGDRIKYKNALPPDFRDQVWGGYMHLFSGILPQVIARYSSETPYWPSSPSNDFSAAGGDDQFGDAHYWAVWHGRAPFSSFEAQYPRFMTEYGFQSFPAMATINTFTVPSDRTLLSPVMLEHQKNTEGNQLIKIYMDREFPPPKDFPSFVYVSQVLQAEGIKIGAEHLRRNRPHVMGSLYWQLNDCWPVASWSSMDYYGRWKALQYYARRFYQDVLVSPNIRDGKVEVSVVSDRMQPLQATVRLQLMDFSGQVVSQKDIPVEIQPLSATQVWEATQKDYLQDSQPENVFLHTELLIPGENNGQPISANNLYFLPYKDLHLPPATIQAIWITVKGQPALRLSSAVLARDVDIETGSLDADPSDNFFDLLPGQPRTIVFKTAIPSDTFRQRVHVMSLTDAFPGPVASVKAEEPHSQ
jgi:beta-mannosidase